MDNFSITLHNYQRLFPSPAQVNTLGDIVCKPNMVDNVFQCFNFSFIIEGAGTYSYDGMEPVEIKAPCVITQWPGAKMLYGPHPGTHWYEVFLIYDKSTVKHFTDSKIYLPEKRWWKIDNYTRCIQAIRAMVKLARGPITTGLADRIDRAAEVAIAESLLPGEKTKHPNDESIMRIKALVETEYLDEMDFEELASQEGLSNSVFRRRWQEVVGMPPHRYLVEQRMADARRMLLQTDLNIGEIANRLGYEDVLYFSRCFRKTTGLTATEYRRNFK